MRTIQDKYIEEAAKRFADDIDFEVLTSLFVESGWTKVVLEPMTWEQGLEIDAWVESNVKGKFRSRGLVWLFKDSKEATWFTLRWSK